VLERMHPDWTAGCQLQEFSFRPTFGKWDGKLCNGFLLHVLDISLYQPYFVSLALLSSIILTHRKHFGWSSAPYEYEFGKKPIDVILGDVVLRQKLEAGVSPSTIKERWSSELRWFDEWRAQYFIY
jgi:uncharacterized protein YbbC (DUF1343 family)